MAAATREAWPRRKPLGMQHQATVPLAAAVKKASGIAVQAVGMIVSPHQAEAIIALDQADFAALARGFLDDPPGLGVPLRRLALMPSTRRSIIARVPNTGRAPRWHAAVTLRT